MKRTGGGDKNPSTELLHVWKFSRSPSMWRGFQSAYGVPSVDVEACSALLKRELRLSPSELFPSTRWVWLPAQRSPLLLKPLWLSLWGGLYGSLFQGEMKRRLFFFPHQIG